MAVTRINNNQISDASAGNAYVGINAATKLQPYSITATKLANNLTYGSDFTVTGNLTVQGNTTAIDTTYTTVEDPILLLASNQTGAPSVDIGFVGQRGTSDNIAFVWDESADEFVTVFTTTGESNTVVSISNYANLHTGNLTVTGSITHSGNVIGNLNVSGNIAGGNLLTPGLVSAAGNINGAGAAFTGNVTALNFIGNIIGNITGNVDAGGANTQVQFNDNDILNGTAGFTFNKTSNAATITGNVTGGNLLTAGLISASGNVYTPRVLNGSTGMYMDAGFPGYIQFFNSYGITVTIGDDGNVNSIANITGANILTGGVVTATGNITSSANVSGANVIATANLVSVGAVVSGNITGGNLLTAGQLSATGNVTGGNLLTAGLVSATGNITSSANVAGANLVASANLVSVGAAVSGNVTGGNLLTAGQVVATGNVSGGNVNATANLVSVGAVVSGNVTGGNLLTAGRVIATGNIQSSANVTGANLVASANLVSVGAVVSGNITGGNLLTAGLIAATGNITSAANIAGGNLTITSAINTGTLNTTGNAVIAGNLFVLGNITYNNVNDLRIEDPVIILGTGPNGAPLTSPDSYDRGTFMEYYTSARGNAWMGWQNSSGNMIAAANVSFSGNDIVSVNAYGTFQAGNIYAQSAVTTGNVTGGNLLTAGLVSATGNVTGGNLSAGSGIITTTGNINGGNLNATTGIRAATGYFTGNVDVLGNLNASIGIVYANSGIFYGNSVTGNAAIYAGIPGYTILGSNVVAQFAGNANSYSQINFENTSNGTSASTDYIATADNGTDSTYYLDMGINSSNFNDQINYPGFGPNDSYVHNHGGNLILNPESAGKVIKFMVGGTANTNVTANVTSTGVNVTGTVVTTGNITGGNLLTAGLVSATGNITSSANVAGANIIASANIVAVGAAVSGNITGGNLLTAGLVSATGNVTGGNVIATANLVSVGAVVSGNVTGGNILTAGRVIATGNVQSSANVTGANLVASANVVSVGAAVSGNITGGNLLTAGLISATGNITGGNLITPNLVSAATIIATGNITGANISTSSLTLNGSNINSNAARITINQIDADVDFAVDGDTVANVFYVDAGTGTVSIGNSTQTTNAILSLNATNSFLMPVGNTAQRPGTGVMGMLRFNSTLDAVEVYDADGWATVGTPSFTIISDEQFNGDSVTVAFTLSAATTTNSTIVSINGIVQIPTIAYSVGGVGSDTLTFTEAPETGDIIDVRILTTTTQVTTISNSPGNAVVAVNPTINEVNITGNLVPVSNAVQSLGSPTAQWKDVYVAGNTIYLGGLQLEASGNTFVVYTSDGVTQANIDVGNVDVSAINSGTSIIGISAPNGNAYITVGGTSNVIVASTTGANITGILSVSGNIVSTGSNGVANIGSATTYFNTVHAKATSAQYADLAEVYSADTGYEPGTVLSFGGTQEVTISTITGDARIAGVVSTNPSYVMNATLNSEHVAVVALTGRVPTKVSGEVSKGDMMVSGGNGRAVACATPSMGTVIGKALENHAGGDGVIEVVVGRL
jgi:filamentous hemagglutinin